MSTRDWLRALPNGKLVSALGFGCSSIWAKPFFSEDLASRILAAAVEEGINHFDTGASYAVGNGERRLGHFLKDRDPTRFVLATKVGTNNLDGQIVRGFSVDLMQRSFDQSMARLGLEYVDILYLHGPTPDALNDDVFRFFERLKAEGRIGYSGVNSFDLPVLDAVVDTPIDAVMLQYNVSDLSAAKAIDRLDAGGKLVMSGTALGRAKFTPGAFWPRDRAHLWYLLRILRHEPSALWRGPLLRRRLKATGKPPATAAIQFVIDHPKIVSNLFGTSSLDHMLKNARAGHGHLGAEQWARLAS